ncbi:hypothetical protein KQX54_014016 [Cotesia glomerata]|uniref:Uncharacterized protein n=1 Tax=Cotesia glomerata TaxID=32391 RepID=A0AAV7HZJ3_COTGL|nr:hypothetical protein KQX54_014016 [Cotesia glomerata]
MSYDEEYRKFYFGELRRELADSEPYAGESPESFYYYLRGQIIQLGECASPLTREVIVRTLHQNLGRHFLSFFPPDLQGQVSKFNPKTLDETYLAFKQVTSASTSPPSIQQEQKIQAAQISVEEQPEENAEEINCQELINNQEATQTEVEPIFENFWDNCEISIVTVFTPVICLEPYCDTSSCSNNMSNYINSTSTSNVDSIHRKLLNGMRLLSFHGAYEFLTHYTKGNFLEQKVFKTQEDTLPVTNLISNGLKFIRKP